MLLLSNSSHENFWIRSWLNKQIKTFQFTVKMTKTYSYHTGKKHNRRGKLYQKRTRLEKKRKKKSVRIAWDSNPLEVGAVPGIITRCQQHWLSRWVIYCISQKLPPIENLPIALDLDQDELLGLLNTEITHYFFESIECR